ncbi:unnamed protein product, partial [Phaeothamnion confervicola]
ILRRRTDPALFVEDDSVTFVAADWSPAGLAWDGGCLLVALMARHTVLVFEPPRSGYHTVWEPVCSVSRAFYEYLCPGGFARADRLIQPEIDTMRKAEEARLKKGQGDKQRQKEKEAGK